MSMLTSTIISTILAVLASEAEPPLRGILITHDRVTSDLLTSWKALGITAVVVPLDDETEPGRWSEMAGVVERAGLSLYPWIEVARNPALAQAHPEWMASPGGHHDDWRRRFPDAPQPRDGEVLKLWPWVPIGYADAFAEHRRRIQQRLDELPGGWAGVFLNDLQAGPSSCGCGNDQCRWAIDYGSTPTAEKTLGDDAAARLVEGLQARFPKKTVIPVWVTECQDDDLPDADPGTGLCGEVPCATGACWKVYARQWNPLLRAARGPIAVAAWSGTFRRPSPDWPEQAVELFRKPRAGGEVLERERVVVLLEAWDGRDMEKSALVKRAESLAPGWVLALDPIDQSWEPRRIKAPRLER